MNYIDAIVLIIVIYFTGMGFKRGLIKEVLALFGLVVAISVCYLFGPLVISYSRSYIDGNWLEAVVYAILFVSCLLLIRLLAVGLTKLSKYAALSLVNRLLGALFGALKASTLFLLLTFAFVYLDGFYAVSNSEQVQSSIAFNLLTNLLDTIKPFFSSLSL